MLLEGRFSVVQMNTNGRLRFNQPSRLLSSGESGIENERVLVLVFESISWEIHTLCAVASLSRRFCAIARRILWRRLCINRAPGMVAALSGADPSGRIDGGWQALAKLMFFCGGGESTRYFNLSQPSPGHFACESRFSKTSGKFFLPKNCRRDLLYMSDPCEHHAVGGDEHLGVFRGVFREFMRSKTRECLVRRQAALEEKKIASISISLEAKASTQTHCPISLGFHSDFRQKNPKSISAQRRGSSVKRQSSEEAPSRDNLGDFLSCQALLRSVFPPPPSLLNPPRIALDSLFFLFSARSGTVFFTVHSLLAGGWETVRGIGEDTEQTIKVSRRSNRV